MLTSHRWRYAALATVLSFSALSTAQDTVNPWGVSLGIVFPADSNLRDSAAKTGFSAGVSYRGSNQPLIKGQTVVTYELGYIRIGGSNHYESFQLGYAERVRFGAEGAASGPFAGFSVGLAYNKLRAQIDDGGGDSGGDGGSGGEFGFEIFSETKSRLSFYAEAILGYSFTPQIGVEGYFRFTPELEGVNLNTFGVRASFKF